MNPTIITLLVALGAPAVVGEGVGAAKVADVQEAIERELDARDAELIADGKIVLRPGPEGVGGFRYRVEVGGEEVVAPELCAGCSELELGRRIVVALEQAEKLQPVPEPKASSAPPPPVVPARAVAPNDATKPAPAMNEERRATRLVAAGASVLIVGSLGLGLGASSFVWSDVADRNRPAFRNAGIAGRAIGGAAVVVGATLMGIAVHALTKVPNRRTAIHPQRRVGGWAVAF